ncbi:MAG: hypothetical protein WAM82_15580 [Thermoanaerobaculia bacterium]
MSLRNRRICVAIALVAALTLAAPVASFAAGLAEGRISPPGAWKAAWSWLTSAVFPKGSLRVLANRWEKEGGAIDPNGTVSTAATPAPAPRPRFSGGGG